MACQKLAKNKKARHLGGLLYLSSGLTSFSLSFHHHKVLLLGGFSQHFAIDTLFLLDLALRIKSAKGLLAPLVKPSLIDIIINELLILTLAGPCYRTVCVAQGHGSQFYRPQLCTDALSCRYA